MTSPLHGSRLVALLAALSAGAFAAAGGRSAFADTPPRLALPSPSAAARAVPRAGRTGAGSLSAAEVQARLRAAHAALAAFRYTGPVVAPRAAVTEREDAIRLLRAPGALEAAGRVTARDAGLQYVDLRDGFTGVRVDTSRPIFSNHPYMLIARSSGAAIADIATLPYSISIPDCNVTVHAAARLTNPGQHPSAGRADANTYVISFTPGSTDAFAIGLGTHTMNLHVPVAGSVLDAAFTVVSDTQTSHSIKAVVDEEGALAADAGSGLSAANMASRVTVRRVNATDTPMFGMDYVGRGVALGTGVTATATVVRASSVADPPDDWSSDNVYRGASVTMQPANGQLETRVEWHIGPHESLQYVVGWHFMTRPGQRVLRSMPLGGACDS